MKQLLLATAALVGMSAAALAAEPVALSDSQLDNVTAGVVLPAPGYTLPAVGFLTPAALVPLGLPLPGPVPIGVVVGALPGIIP